MATLSNLTVLLHHHQTHPSHSYPLHLPPHSQTLNTRHAAYSFSFHLWLEQLSASVTQSYCILHSSLSLLAMIQKARETNQ